MPPEYAQAYGIAETPVQEATTSESAQQTASDSTAVDIAQQALTDSNQDSTTDSSIAEATTTTKRSVEQSTLESRETHQPSKRRAGPYGAWSTVAVYDRTEEELLKESKGGAEGTEEGDSSEEDDQKEDK